jgi:hypothetical protein
MKDITIYDLAFLMLLHFKLTDQAFANWYVVFSPYAVAIILSVSVQFMTNITKLTKSHE